jgi:glycosyltransferase involved in cell wall biosynthesis
VTIRPGYEIQFVHAPGYKSNIGIHRLRTYRILDRRLRELARREPAPDLIVAAIPTLEWATAAVDIAQTYHLPVVIDVRDTWPDVYLNAVPAPARRSMRFLLAAHFRRAKRICQEATCLTAVSNSYLDWALSLADRASCEDDVVVPLGYDFIKIADSKIRSASAALERRGITAGRMTCLFAGRFERSYDLVTVVEAARRLKALGIDQLQFVLCGDGATLPAVKRHAYGLANVHLLGSVEPATVAAIASISSIGLCAYASDATQSLPNKPFEYMAHRLAVVSSLSGEMADLLSRHDCGLTYRAGCPDSLTRCVKLLLDEPELVARLRTNAWDTWSRHYRSREIYSQFASRLTNFTQMWTQRIHDSNPREVVIATS